MLPREPDHGREGSEVKPEMSERLTLLAPAPMPSAREQWLARRSLSRRDALGMLIGVVVVRLLGWTVLGLFGVDGWTFQWCLAVIASALTHDPDRTPAPTPRASQSTLTTAASRPTRA
jgi:hypothetical protein